MGTKREKVATSRGDETHGVDTERTCVCVLRRPETERRLCRDTGPRLAAVPPEPEPMILTGDHHTVHTRDPEAQLFHSIRAAPDTSPNFTNCGHVFKPVDTLGSGWR